MTAFLLSHRASVRFHVCFLRMESFFFFLNPQPYGSPKIQHCWPSKPNVLELFFLVQEYQAEEQLEVWLRPLAFQGETLKL